VHEEEVDIADVVDEEGLVAGWHHVAGLLVGSETNLSRAMSALSLYYYANCLAKQSAVDGLQTYRWHNHLALKASADTVVDTLWLSP
jgi:hypothetical protein